MLVPCRVIGIAPPPLTRGRELKSDLIVPDERFGAPPLTRGRELKYLCFMIMRVKVCRPLRGGVN